MHRLALAGVAAVSILCQSRVTFAQNNASRGVEAEIGELRSAITALSKQVSDLTRAVKGALPPSPIEDIGPLEVDITGSAKRGSPEAKIAIIEFADFECPYCASHANSTFKELQAHFVESGMVQYVFRHLPLAHIHPSANRAAEAAECAREQGQFWEMHEHVFANQQALNQPDLENHAKTLGMDLTLFKSCLTEHRAAPRVQADLAESKRLKLNGTPAFLIGAVTADGRVRVVKQVIGARPFAVFKAALEGMW